jgi:hypothetical protein
MARQGINTGTSPNDGLGDSLLAGAIKINSNFSEIYSAFGNGNSLVSYANTAGIATISQGLIGTPNISVNQVGISSYLTVTGVTTFQNSVYLGDNDFIYFGDSGDLYIGHNGSVSAIADAGTGDLYIAGDNSLIITDLSYAENKAKFNTNGSVELYYDNSKKFETLGTGVTVTGTTFTNQLNVSGVVTATKYFGDGSSLTGVSASGSGSIDLLEVMLFS